MSPFDPAGQRQSSHRNAAGDGARARSSQARGRSRGRVRDRRGDSDSRAFYLYVEGPRDRDILHVWARCVSRELARILKPCAVILGGRRPARAIEHFRERGGLESGANGIVVLDRDHHSDPHDGIEDAPGLEFFTWGRRHIESYVLVPEAIRRAVHPNLDQARAGRLIEDHVPRPEDEALCRDINAKHLLGSKGPLARGLGVVVPPATIARCMRIDELHPEVLGLLSRIGTGLGLPTPGPKVMRRNPVSPG